MRRALVVVAALGFQPLATVAQQPDRRTHDTLTAAREGWQRYMTLVENVQGTVAEEVFELRNPAIKVHYGYEVRHSGKCARGVALANPAAGEGLSAYFTNRDYSFELTRASSDRPWAVKQYGGSQSTYPFDGPAWGGVNELRLAPLTILAPTEKLPLLFGEADFKVVAVTDVDQDGERLVRIDFECAAKDARHGIIAGVAHPGGSITVERGRLTLDPGRYWLIRSYDVHCRLGPPMTAKVTAEYEYREIAKGLPVLAKLTRQFEQYDPPTVADNRHLYTYDLTDTLPPESEFYLSALGLPEPAERRTQGNISYLWFLVAAVIVFACALAYWRVVRRTHLRSEES